MNKVDTSAEAVERLRKAAEEVGAEEWTLYLGDEDWIIAVVTYDPQPGRRAHIVSPPIYPKDVKRSETRTRYIAAAHPAAVLALIAERDMWRAENIKKQQACEQMGRRIAALEAERSVLIDVLTSINRETGRARGEQAHRDATRFACVVSAKAIARKNP